MSISYIPEQKPYKNLTPFKRFVLQSFPWINEDFDALTNNELLAKVIEYLNGVIANEENVEFNVNELYDAFVELYNYFNNLDVQDEINNKLDAMVLDGTMGEIINQEIFGEINTRLDNLESTKTMIVIGDSYSNNAQSGTPLWYTYVANWHKLNVYTNASDGQGYATGSNTFLNQLTTANNHFTDKSVIDRIYIVGGLNDLGNNNLTANQFLTAVNNTLNYAITNFPNIPIYVVGIFPFQYYNFYSGENGLEQTRAYNFEKYLAYSCSQRNVCFKPAGTIGLNCNDFFGNANQYNQKHPSAIGEKIIANYIENGTQIAGTPSISNTNWNTTPYTLTNGTNTSMSIYSLSSETLILKIENYDQSQNLTLDLRCFPTYRSYAKVRVGIDVFVANIDYYTLSIASNNKIPSGTIYIELPLCYNPQTYIK